MCSGSRKPWGSSTSRRFAATRWLRRSHKFGRVCRRFARSSEWKRWDEFVAGAIWIFVDEFLLTGSGKIQKFVLRERWDKGEFAA